MGGVALLLWGLQMVRTPRGSLA